MMAHIAAKFSRPVARHLGAGPALVSPAAAGRRDRHAQQPDARHPAPGALGRGTAKMEYDAYNIDMNEGRARFAEGASDHGEGPGGQALHPSGPLLESSSVRSACVPIPVDKPVRFYGGPSAARASAEVMGELGIAPICACPPSPTDCWPRSSSADARARRRQGDAARSFPSPSRCSSPTPTRRRASWAAAHYPAYFALQADHYEADANPWAGIPEYTDFSRMFANLRKLANPAELLGSFLCLSPISWAASRPSASASMRSPASGFNYFKVSSRDARHAVRRAPAE